MIEIINEIDVYEDKGVWRGKFSSSNLLHNFLSNLGRKQRIHKCIHALVNALCFKHFLSKQVANDIVIHLLIMIISTSSRLSI